MNSTRSTPSHRIDLLPKAAALDLALDDDPPADGRILDDRLGGTLRRRRPRAGRREVPRAFAEDRMVRVLAVGEDLVGDAAGPDELLACARVVQAPDRAAEASVDRQPEALVLDGIAIGCSPGRLVERPRARQRSVRPVAEGRHVAGQEGDPCPRRRTIVTGLDGFRQRRALRDPDSSRSSMPAAPSVNSTTTLADIGPGPRHRVEHDDGPTLPRGVDPRGEVAQGSIQARLPSSSASRHPPRRSRYTWSDSEPVIPSWWAPNSSWRHALSIACAREPCPEEHRQRAELLGGEERVLGGSLGLLGVDERNVLAGVDRVHVACLRGERSTRRPSLLAHGLEELPRDGGQELRPDVAPSPVAVDRRQPFVRWRVVGPHGQQDVLRRSQRREIGEQAMDFELGLLERRRRIHPPACRVMVGLERREQPSPAWGDPLELARELHPSACRPAPGSRSRYVPAHVPSAGPTHGTGRVPMSWR